MNVCCLLFRRVGLSRSAKAANFSSVSRYIWERERREIEEILSAACGFKLLWHFHVNRTNHRIPMRNEFSSQCYVWKGRGGSRIVRETISVIDVNLIVWQIWISEIICILTPKVSPESWANFSVINRKRKKNFEKEIWKSPSRPASNCFNDAQISSFVTWALM